ncbi:MAG TPA: FHA domain-containing protein [Blastocatellia bacterium]|nr:FHA domain-containing protein [Blastocatellia bacterium]
MEEAVRKWLDRLGEYLDRALGRESEGVTLPALIPAVQKAIEHRLAADRQGIRRIAPNRITLRLPVDLYTRLDEAGRANLETVVREIAQQYIADHRYTVTGALGVSLLADVQLASSFVVEADHQEEARHWPRWRLRRLEDETVVVALETLDPQGRFTVGRSPDNDIVIAHESLSRFHATLSLGADGLPIIADCGSANGTFVNERRVTTHCRIQPGDEVRLGAVRLVVEDLSSSSSD